MRKISKGLLSIILAMIHFLPAGAQQTSKYKCMIQMNSYLGEGAYIVVSLIGADNNYSKTLYMLGPDKEWYPDFKEWHKAYKKKPADISAVTGASVAGGDRAVITLEIEKSRINAGYKLRFESAVEDKPYHVKDVEMPLTTEALAAKTEGTGYIRYVRFSGTKPN
jgi:hypothetical protein